MGDEPEKPEDVVSSKRRAIDDQVKPKRQRTRYRNACIPCQRKRSRCMRFVHERAVIAQPIGLQATTVHRAKPAVVRGKALAKR